MENNWTIEQTKKLFKLAKKAQTDGKGLSFAFSQMAQECNRKVNSVRNYYYSQLKMFELVPKIAADLGIELNSYARAEFELFTEKEIDDLIVKVLCAKANGISVRACIAEISGGDAKLGLRLQNKYRSMITHHRDRVTKLMKELGKNGTPYFNPYLKQTVCGAEPDNYKKLGDYIASLDESEVSEFLTLMQKLFA